MITVARFFAQMGYMVTVAMEKVDKMNKDLGCHMGNRRDEGVLGVYFSCMSGAWA